MNQEIELTGAKSPRLQLLTERCDELSDVAGNRLGRADRLAENPADLDDRRFSDRIDRLCGFSERLIYTPANLQAEAKSQRRARLVDQFADQLEA